MYQPTITNEAINEMPVGHFPGRILVVDSDEAMLEAERVLAGESVLGYDTETRPSFERGVKYGMSLVQICTADTALLFRVKLAPLSESIRAILSSPEVIKVGAAIREDIRGMHKVAEFKPAGFIDLQSVIKRWGIEELSVKKMGAIVLGMKVSKAQRLTNWEAVRLTEPQQDYAAMDAWVCREIYVRLSADQPELMAEARKTFMQQQAEGELPAKKKISGAGRRHHSRPGRRRNRKPTDITPNDTHDTTDAPAR